MSWDPRNQGGYQGSEKDIEEVIRQAKSQFESFKNKGKGLWTLVIILVSAVFEQMVLFLISRLCPQRGETTHETADL